jgi:hypothetical protein
MVLDVLTRVSNAQAFTGAATPSTDAYDTGASAVVRRLGDGTPLALLVIITTAAGAGTSCQFDLISSAAVGLGSPAVHASRTFAAAALPVGTMFTIVFPSGTNTLRYVGMQNTNTGGTTTVSATAYIMPLSMIDKFTIYSKGYTIS